MLLCHRPFMLLKPSMAALSEYNRSDLDSLLMGLPANASIPLQLAATKRFFSFMDSGSDNRSKPTPRAHWPIGWVVKLIPIRDGCVWTVEIQMRYKVYIRPVARLIPLPAAQSCSNVGVAVQNVYPVNGDAHVIGAVQNGVTQFIQIWTMSKLITL